MAKPSLREKDILNQEGAICYWNFCRARLYKFLKQTDGGNFLAFYKERVLIIRFAFEQYLFRNPEMKEELANGKSRKRKN